ncbi:hypothetical protein HY933_01500 [Candidatus Falkowbacteria bacterium]|nr:hypothetical protein [Candidatus Falkowbacteria bacterium]
MSSIEAGPLIPASAPPEGLRDRRARLQGSRRPRPKVRPAPAGLVPRDTVELSAEGKAAVAAAVAKHLDEDR